jgi:hypothetical protein
MGKNKVTPYNDLEHNDVYIIREFDQNIDPKELMWHRDDEERLIETLEPTNWLIQFENKLPVLLNTPIFIPKHAWHRVIKRHGKLKIKIYKY